MTQESSSHTSYESKRIQNKKLIEIGIFSQGDFMREACTHYGRIILAYKLKKPVENINNLAAFFDLLRIDGMTPKLAALLVLLGIAGVKDLRTQDSHDLCQYFLGLDDVSIQKFSIDDIKQALLQSRQTPLVIFDLYNKKLAQDCTKYATTKYYQQKEIEYIRDESKKEFFDFIVQSLGFIVLSYFSIYFLYFILVLLVFHIYKNSYFIARYTYSVRKYIEQYIYKQQGIISYMLGNIQNSLSEIKNILCISIVLLSVILFSLGVMQGRFMQQIQFAFQHENNLEQDQESPLYLDDEIFNIFQGTSITRAQLIGILIYSIKPRKEIPSQSHCFGDIQSSVYKQQICYAQSQGYVSGDANHNFNPTGVASNAVGLKFILNFYGADIPRRALYITYNDITRNDWFSTYAEYAKSNGLIATGESYFYPDEDITIQKIDRYMYQITEINRP